MDADPLVGIERRSAEQVRELAGGQPPQRIHLEEAFLAMQKAEREGDVLPALAGDDRHALGIAGDGDRGGQAGRLDPAFQLRLGHLQHPGQIGGGKQDQQQDRAQQPLPDPERAPPHNPLRHAPPSCFL